MLNKDKVNVNLKTRQDRTKNFYVEGLTHTEVKNSKQLLKLLKVAQSNRASHSTSMNELSSRSHLVMTITVNKVDQRDLSLQSAKLNLVDLAGSERIKDSQVTGQQLKEACYINKSLFALAGVVDSLQHKVKN